MYFVVLWYIIFCPSIRKKCRPYLNRRLSDRTSLWVHFIDDFRLVTSFAKNLIDRAVLGIIGPHAMTVDFPDSQKLKQIEDDGNGMIILGSHVGCWQVAFSTLDHLDSQVNLLMHRDTFDIDKHYYEHDGEKPPFGIIDPAGYLGGAVELAAVLQQRGILAIMGDRLFGENPHALTVNFLGEPIQVPRVAYRLSAIHGTPIVVLFPYKTGHSTYTIEIAGVITVPKGFGRKPQQCTAYAQEYANLLEEFTKKHPYEFFNFFDMWSIE